MSSASATSLGVHRKVHAVVTQDARDDYGMYPSLSQTGCQRVAEIMPTADHNVQLLASRMYVANRPGLNELLKDCRRRAFDVVVVWKFDRFARSLNNLIAGLEFCRALGIDFVSVTEAVDTSLPAGEMLFQMIGAVAQFERSLIAERVKSGLANARANGKVGPTSVAQIDLQGGRGSRSATCAHERLPFRALARNLASRSGQLTDYAQMALAVS